jgi:hypothetical protein
MQYKTVTFPAQQLATLSQGGQYQYSAGTFPYIFKLARKNEKNGIWLITQLPQGNSSLLLTQASFEEVYQPRNLFFCARYISCVNGELVPDPVYAPVQSADSALNTDVAAGLVHGLLKDQGSWLSGATTTAFPRGTSLLKVAFRGRVAVVDLGGAAARASTPQKYAMQAQLLATLTSKAYSSPLAQNVSLEINGRSLFTGPNSNLVSPVSPAPLVYESGPGVVSQVNPNSDLVQTGPAQITTLAATASGAGGKTATAVAMAVPNGGGCAVDIQFPPPSGVRSTYQTFKFSGKGGPCTSLSWDRNENLWAVAGGQVWMLPTQAYAATVADGTDSNAKKPTPVAVSLGNLQPHGKSGPRILSLQMAPDGVRAALLVATPGSKSPGSKSPGSKSPGSKSPWSNQVLLAAVNVKPGEASLGAAVPTWTGLDRPTAVSWESAYYLVVLTKTGIWQVPLTGSAGRLLGSAPAGAVSLTTDGVTLVVGTVAGPAQTPGVIYSSRIGANSWVPAHKVGTEGAIGEFPTYVGLVPEARPQGCGNGGTPPPDTQRGCG